jgi:hypothetical protein
VSEARPDDQAYYEIRHEYLSQGDIFRNVPAAYPFPLEDLVVEDPGARRFFAGPLDDSYGLLITPSCSMQAQRRPLGEYAHPVRAIVPVVALAQLAADGTIASSALPHLRTYDNLINYMYLPASEAFAIPESVALLWLPVSLHHRQLDGLRVAQLARAGTQQLHRKLQWFYTGMADSRAEFDPLLD